MMAWLMLRARWRDSLRIVATCASVLVANVAAPCAHAESSPVVAAAASLRYALEEIAALFEVRTGQRVRLTFGATGSIVHQIENGAPYELFIAADEGSVMRLAGDGRTQGAPTILALGRISLVAPRGSPVAVDAEFAALAAALAAGKVDHFAIANPQVAPYGRAAREALEKAGLWAKVAPHLVTGENVGQAAQFATTGAVQAGIIAHSLAVSPEMAPRITAALIPEDWHQPVKHGMALLKGAGDVARSFADFVKGSEARAILERNGFSAPAP